MLKEAIDTLTKICRKPELANVVSATANRRVSGVMVPEGYTFQKVYEETLHPELIAQTVQFDELESFADYCNRFGTGDTVIFLSLQQDLSISLTAKIDYHKAAGIPAFVKHSAVFAPVTTPEWKVWIGNNKKAMEQTDFAQFLEDNLPDITAPVAGELIDICRALEINQTTHYTKAVKMQDGSINLQFKEDNQPAGNYSIPQYIEITIVPFRGEAPATLKANLRYRLRNGECLFFYEFVRPHKVIEAAGAEMRERFKTLTEAAFPIYSGLMA